MQLAIHQLFKQVTISAEVADEIAEVVFEDMELGTSVSKEELAVKCQLIRSLFSVIEALAKRFGEVHLE